MKLQFAPDQNYDCVMCGKGCVEKWDIVVDSKAEMAVRGTDIELRVIQDNGGPPFDVFPATSRGRVVGRKDDNRCVFLGEDKLCEIHREMGIESKPVPCRQFPFVVKQTPDGLHVGITFFCTSAQRNSGRPLAEHEAEVREILKTIEIQRIGFRPLKVIEGFTLDWDLYRDLERWTEELLISQGPSRAFSHGFFVLSKACSQSEPGALTRESLEKLWKETPVADLSDDPMMGYQLELFLGALVGVTEVGNNLEHQAICQAFLEGTPYALPRLGAEVNFSTARQLRHSLEKQFSGEIERYFKSLFFRKYLASSRPVLDNFILGYLLNRFLTGYTALYAQKRGAEPTLEDYYRALDLVEADVVTHARGLDKLIAAYSDAVHRFLCIV